MQGNRQLTILAPSISGKDADGVSSRTWTAGETVVGFFHQKNASEYVDGSWQSIERWQAYLPAGVTIDFTYAVQTEDGNIYRVQSVAPRLDPFGNVHHLMAYCTKAGA